MSWMYRLFTRSNDESTLTLDPSVTLITSSKQAGTSTVPVVLSTADKKADAQYYTGTATSGTTCGEYTLLNGSGAGAEEIASRSKVLLNVASVGNAHGSHSTLELDTSAGNVTGLGTGSRSNVVVADRSVTAGTYYGLLAEIYPLGNTSALPAGTNACLGINAQAGTAMDLVVNAISFNGTSGKGKMLYSVTPSTIGGSIRILVNGVKCYLAYYTTEGA